VIVIAGTGSIAYRPRPPRQHCACRRLGIRHRRRRFRPLDRPHRRRRCPARRRPARYNFDEARAAASRIPAAALCKSWGVTSLDDLARAANSISTPDFAALFPTIAASEDVIARKVAIARGRELAQVVAVVSHRLFGKEDAAPIPVAMTGGVFRHSPQVREDFYNDLRHLDPRAEIIPQVVDPVEGALRMARRSGGVRV